MKRNPHRDASSGWRADRLDTWAKETIERLVKNAKFWIGTGMTPEEALKYVFSQSAAGPKIRDAVRARVLARSNPSDIVKQIKALVPASYRVRMGTGSQRGAVTVHRPPQFDHLEWCRISRMLRKRFPNMNFGHTLAGEEFCHYWLDLTDAQRKAADARREAERRSRPGLKLVEVPQHVIDRALGIKRNPRRASRASSKKRSR